MYALMMALGFGRHIDTPYCTLALLFVCFFGNRSLRHGLGWIARLWRQYLSTVYHERRSLADGILKTPCMRRPSEGLNSARSSISHPCLQNLVYAAYSCSERGGCGLACTSATDNLSLPAPAMFP